MVECYRKHKKPLLSKKHRLARLAFARAYFDEPVEYWRNVLFSDESKYNVIGPDGYHSVWRMPGAPLQDWQVHGVIKFGGGSVTLWGVISYQGVGRLMFVEGRMDSRQFIHILKYGLGSTLQKYNWLPNDIILQQDNDSKHTSKMTREWIAEHNITVLPWPSRSPDLNIIENLWYDVEVRVRSRNKTPSNVKELRAAIEEEWYATPLSYIRSLYDSIPRRLEAVLRAKGRSTKY